jgi:uncharacterized protein with WD repeat
MVKAVDYIQHRTLAGAIGTDNGANLPAFDVKANIVENFHDAEGKTDIVDREDHIIVVFINHAAASRLAALTG